MSSDCHDEMGSYNGQLLSPFLRCQWVKQNILLNPLSTLEKRQQLYIYIYMCRHIHG